MPAGDFELRLPALIGALRSLVRVALEAEVREMGEDAESHFVAHAAQARRILESGGGVLASLLELFDARAAEESAEQVEKLGPVSAHAVADHLFVVQMELQHLASQLASSGDHHAGWALLSHCNHALGSFIKAGIATEQLLCRRLGQRSELSALTESRQAIDLRRLFAYFRRRIAADGPPEATSIVERLLDGAQAIAAVLESESGPSLRLADRQNFLRLQRRIWRWEEQRPRDPARGMEIWQDLYGLSELLLQINQREELIQHDRQVVAEALDRMADRDHPPDPVELASLLRDLCGRCQELDRLLERPAGLQAYERLRQLLGRLEEELAQAEGAGSFSSEAPQPV
ncbi:MAG: hypothetical protein Q9Q40_05530 [Acidobacteriota bacterium]|nr:hypothetical protein [Acidobacteriota bacterium]MDQ7087787.1 hypothetical protein [Acidobacteriota bacterium]